MSSTDPPGLRVPLVLAGLCLAVSLAGMVPPAPRSADAPPDEFSAARALAQLKALNPEDTPHPVASPANARVRDRLQARLRELGLTPEVQVGLACDAARNHCSWVENVLARIPGETPGPAVMVAAHYDSRASAPGAGDAGAGVASALELARALGHRPPPRDVLLFFDDGEEGGLHGARLFARDAAARADVAAVVNLEARGTAGPSFMFETSEGNAGLIRWFARSASRPSASSLYFTIYRLLPNDTDLTIFKAAGMRGLNFAFLDGPADYHTPRDRFDVLDRATLQHHGQNALDLVRGAGELGPPTEGNAIYFDLGGRVLVHFPIGAALPLAVLALVLTVVRARRRTPELTAGTLAWVLGESLAAFLAGVLVLAGGHALLLAAGAAPARWVAYPAPLLASQWLLGIILAGAGAAVLGARRSPALVEDVHWVGMALVGVAAAAVTPGMSYLLWMPSLVAGGVALGTRWPGIWTRKPWVVLLLLWLPLAAMLYVALGLHMPGLHGLVAWLLAAPLGASLAATGGRALRAGAVAAVALGLVSLLVPRFTPEVPCPLTLRFVEDATSARWEVLTYLEELPGSLVAAAPFARTGEGYGGLHSRVASFRAPVERRGLPPPEVVASAMVEDPDRPGGGLWKLHLRTARGARRLGVTLPAGSPVGEVRFLDQLVFPGSTAPLDAPRDLLVRLPAGRVLEVTLAVNLESLPPLRVWDMTDDLPVDGARVQEARPAWAVPAHDADHTRVERALAPPAP